MLLHIGSFLCEYLSVLRALRAFLVPQALFTMPNKNKVVTRRQKEQHNIKKLCECKSPAEGVVREIERYAQKLTQGHIA